MENVSENASEKRRTAAAQIFNTSLNFAKVSVSEVLQSKNAENENQIKPKLDSNKCMRKDLTRNKINELNALLYSLKVVRSSDSIVVWWQRDRSCKGAMGKKRKENPVGCTW